MNEKSENSKKHFAYMLRCSDGTIYSGYSTNPMKRAEVHNSGHGAKYTRSRLPAELVYYETFETKSEAMKREAAFKRLSREQKLNLIKYFKQ